MGWSLDRLYILYILGPSLQDMSRNETKWHMVHKWLLLFYTVLANCPPLTVLTHWLLNISLLGCKTELLTKKSIAVKRKSSHWNNWYLRSPHLRNLCSSQRMNLPERCLFCSQFLQILTVSWTLWWGIWYLVHMAWDMDQNLTIFLGGNDVNSEKSKKKLSFSPKI